ncbi:hypothetical protein [Clostridium sp. OS1-26]|uniref:hypothetical protein n=1 Tax=Clostridium sp. OS1-26 TaxID=3070681 RepID=UPI0027DF8722|nr:hypothetical protein [Clostridium sp. OS1-26]WML35897.1 hypothetical protein RCG18_03890 [Clostridium sp. OS1-26]
MDKYIKASMIFLFTLLFCEITFFILDKKLAKNRFRLTDRCRYTVESTLCIILGFISGVLV